MQTTLVPCFNYYRTALFTDDSQRHLTRMTIELDSHLPSNAFSEPQKVLRYIQTHGRPNEKIQKDDLYLEIQNPNRFNEPSLLVTDYAMPGTNMNGFELCSQVKQLCHEHNIPSPKIILLSGQAGEEIGQEGINKGYIDQYVSKTDPSCTYKLNRAIQALQMQFSIEKSAPVLKELSAKPDFCFNDLNFIQLFKELCKENEIVEYFPLGSSGDFLLSQFDGSLLWLRVIPVSLCLRLSQ